MRKVREKRSFSRVNHHVVVTIGENHYTTRDISPGGCFVVTDSPLSVGTEVDMVIDIEGHEIKCSGVVRHTKKQGMGIEFKNINREDYKVLLKHIHESSHIEKLKSLFAQVIPHRREKKDIGTIAKHGVTFLEGVKIILYLIVLVSIIVPLLGKGLERGARNKAIREFEQKRGSKVIEMIHARETVSLFGIPVRRYLTIRDAETILNEIRSIPDEKPIDMIIHTTGGQLLSAFQIAKALKRHRGKVTVFIPQYAMSAGTIIALAADEIVMDHNAVIGPTDPQFMIGKNVYPAVSVVKIPEKKSINSISDNTLILVDQAQKAINQVKDMIKELLGNKYKKNLSKIEKRLVGGVSTHDYPIFYEEAKKLGLPVNDNMPDDVYKILRLYLK